MFIHIVIWLVNKISNDMTVTELSVTASILSNTVVLSDILSALECSVVCSKCK